MHYTLNEINAVRFSPEIEDLAKTALDKITKKWGSQEVPHMVLRWRRARDRLCARHHDVILTMIGGSLVDDAMDAKLTNVRSAHDAELREFDKTWWSASE